MEINVVNPQILSVLDKTRDMFLEHEDTCTELAEVILDSMSLQDEKTYVDDGIDKTPTPDWEKYCSEEWLWKQYDKGENHSGFPEQAYGFQVAHGVRNRPDLFTDLKNWAKGDLPREFGASSSSLVSYYPPNGFVGWHTNWNAFGWQMILTWSQDGDGYFSYYDKEKNEIITEQDVKGWQGRWYRFGRLDEPEHHCWHCAWTNCPRITLAFKFPYGKLSERLDTTYDAIQDMIERLETA